jgi:hypothetical protein
MGNVARRGEKRNAYELWVVNPEGTRLLGMHKHRREDNIKTDIKEWDGSV